MALKKKRILILSEGFGAGHTQAAHALSVGLRQIAPDVQTRVLELGTFLHPTIMPLVYAAYRKTLTSKPELYAKLYRSQYNKSLSRWMELMLHRLFYAQTAEVLRQLRPDAVVCTHPFPNAVISRLKRSGLNIPLYTVITDYDLHGAWVTSETNAYLVSTPGVKRQLLSRGVPPHKINVTGIPVHPNFWRQHDKEEIRRRFGLKAMPTVLIMGGGWGIVSDLGLLEHMMRWRESIQFIICLGNNRKTQEKLQENPVFVHPNVRLLGFVKEIDQLMEVSDLLVTKPGGLTVTEALTKGIPMLFYQAIPGQEEENCQYFLENGYGELLDSPEKADQWMFKLTNNYEEIAAKRARFHQMAVNYQPTDCPRAILRNLS
jgi:processive 1,2-diacylglycerol beta-glucosyltransferase